MAISSRYELCIRCNEPKDADVHRMDGGDILPFSKVSRLGKHEFIPPNRGY